MGKIYKYLKEIIQSVFTGDFRLFLKHCGNCNARRPFLVSGRESRSVRCLGCRATLISLSSLEYIKDLKLDRRSSFVYELSYHGPVFTFLKNNFENFYFSEYLDPSKLGTLIEGVRNEDIQRLTFEDKTFDLISCTEVFEHVEDYSKGFKEIRRVLKPGGTFVFTVPLFDNEKTEHICSVDGADTLVWHGKPEFHDSRVSGPNSVPVFWRHSRKQIIKDLRDIGFSNAYFVHNTKFSPRVTQEVIIATC